MNIGKEYIELLYHNLLETIKKTKIVSNELGKSLSHLGTVNGHVVELCSIVKNFLKYKSAYNRDTYVYMFISTVHNSQVMKNSG